MSAPKRTLLAWLIGVPLALVVLLSASTWVYINILRDEAPERLSLTDITTTTAGGDPTPTQQAASAAEGVEGTWTVGEGTQVGYRVKETLNGQSTEGVGRTDKVTGTVVITGTQATEAAFTVDMASITSDDSRRDGQYRNRIMNVATYPTATFKLTKPIDFGSLPATGTTVTAAATGDLTLHGATRPVTFDLEAQHTADGIRIAGTIPITFADYGIDNPSGGPAQVGDEGELEFLLSLTR